jgi:DNA-binding MarR family transcriptional regulator
MNLLINNTDNAVHSSTLPSLREYKRSLVEIGEGLTPSQEREEVAIAETKKQLNLARRLTAFVYSDSVKNFFCNQRNLCLGILRNANKAAILRKIVTRHLTKDGEQLYLQYHHDIGYSFYHSAKQFAADLFISVSTVYKLINDLADEGWIEIYHKQDVFGRKIYHLKLKIENFIKRAEIYMQSHLSFFDKCVYQNLPNDSYINKQKKEKNNLEEKNFSNQKNSFADPIRIENGSVGRVSGVNIHTRKPTVEADKCQTFTGERDLSKFSFTHLDSPEEINDPQVDEKINSKSVLKKQMAKHTPGGDRHFGQTNQQSEVRSRAKMDSAVGMSGFTDVEELRECQNQLTKYFAKQLEPIKAAEKASWIIKAERQGERSPFVQDYLDGVAIGSWCKEEWEIEPGRIAPVLIAYLRCKLRKNGDTHAHSLNRVSWELKNRNLTANHWAECKRLIDIEKPRLEKALELGQDLVTQNVPEWIIEIYRPEVSVERAAETAEVLGAIATQYNDRIEQVQRQLEPAKYADHLFEDSKGSSLHRLKQALGLPTEESNKYQVTSNDPLIEEEERKKAADAVMDRIVSDGKKLDLAEMLPNLPEAKLIRLQSEIEEISDLLSDPITRETGLRRAGNLGLPILYSNDGEAIAIDTVSIKDDDEINFNNISRDGSITSSEGKYQAHQIYQPEQIEKGSKSAWDEAIAKSKFFKKVRKTTNL